MYIMITKSEQGGHTRWTEEKVATFDTEDKLRARLASMTTASLKNIKVYKAQEVKVSLELKLDESAERERWGR